MAEKREQKFAVATAVGDGVYELRLAGEGEHRLNPTTLAAWHAALDEVESAPDAAALITTNDGRFFSNGLDLAFIAANPDQYENIILLTHELLERLLIFPIPTVAAVCGHAVAAGCMLALAHDYRFMRTDRGLIFLNEADNNLPLPPGMNAVVRCKLPPATYHAAVLSAQRYTGQAAAAAGFVEAAFPDVAATRQAAIARATQLAAKKYNRAVYKLLKQEMFKREIEDLHEGLGISRRIGFSKL